MIRAVLDTNVVVSALIYKATAFPVATAWKQHRFQLLVSPPLLEEYIRVLHYPKFRLTQREIAHLLYQELVPFLTPVKATPAPRVIHADPSDNHVLACAVAGKAGVIVSGDHHLLKVGRYRRVPIVTLADFLARLDRA